VDGFTRQMDARGSDVVALRAEADKLRRDIDLINNKLDAIPQTFSKLLEEQRRSIMAEVNRNISTSVANVQRQRTSSGSSGSGKFYEHEVQSGQTLSEIARVYEVTMAEIMRENKIKDASLIRVGQKLLIPAK
jgi:secreted protein with Ig-like and vWFA domain